MRRISVVEVEFEVFSFLSLLFWEKLPEQAARLELESYEIDHVQLAVYFLLSPFYFLCLSGPFARPNIFEAEPNFENSRHQRVLQGIWCPEPSDVVANSPDDALKAANITQKV